MAAFLAGSSAYGQENISGNPAGINRLEQIRLGGIDQWISLQGSDDSKPVLLILHGGPGFAMMSLFHENNRTLEDHFIVVNWDQRGAGRSCSPDIPAESMTLEQFISDAHELTDVLKARFGRRKIFLIGHSFGTVLGTYLIHRFPGDYYAFCGVGQVVDTIENEQLGYDFALAEAGTDRNRRAVRELKRVGRPDEQGEYRDDSGYDITMKWVSFYGGEVYGERDSAGIEDEIINSEIYEDYQEELFRGWEFSQELFNDEAVWAIDLRRTIPRVDVPVYFFTGRFDYDTPHSLAEEYCDLLRAPVKEIVWFEKSAHFPFYEEPERFNEMIISRFSGVLAGEGPE